MTNRNFFAALKRRNVYKTSCVKRPSKAKKEKTLA